MGRIARIGKAILQELHFSSIKTVEVPVPTADISLEGRLALVTGGTSGIGYEISKAFVDRGCCVALSGRDEERVQKAVKSIGSNNAKGFVFDVTEIQVFGDAIDAAASLFPEKRGIDILVNSAGIMRCPPFEEVEEDLFNKIINTNLKAPFFLSQTIAEHMKERHLRGNILNISSSASLRNAKGPYEISKWGITGMTKGLAEVLIKDGIVVNAIAPGPTATAMLGKENADDIQNPANPSGRYASSAEIANLACLLVSSYADLVVGQTLYATGGAGTICIHK